jgi:phosphonoacetaldehyde hydrolase
VSLSTHSVRLVIFDWAGTTIDHGSRAPLAPFVRAFASQGVDISPDEARAPMGLPKKDHIRALLQVPAIRRRWRERHGRDPDEKDAEELYRRFIPLQMGVLDNFDRLVPGLLDLVESLRKRGVSIGATTGYFREAAEHVYRSAARQGYTPDRSLCADDVPQGRPAPWMVFRIMEELAVYPPSAVVKVGDTVPDIGEGHAAGAWTVGVLRSSSEVGCTEEEWDALAPPERSRRVSACREELLAAGAHAVVETLAELQSVLDEFNARLQRGEKP